MDDMHWPAAVAQIVVVVGGLATLWLQQRKIKNDLADNTKATQNIETIVNGERSTMIVKIAQLEAKVELLTAKVLKEGEQHG